MSYYYLSRDSPPEASVRTLSQPGVNLVKGETNLIYKIWKTLLTSSCILASQRQEKNVVKAEPSLGCNIAHHTFQFPSLPIRRGRVTDRQWHVACAGGERLQVGYRSTLYETCIENTGWTL